MTRDSVMVWLAEGFGSGRAPKAPGTFGSIVGCVWTALLLIPGHAWFFWLGAVAAAGAAVWICGEAERILGAHDPGSIVLDEIVALPFCVGALVTSPTRGAGFPDLATWLGAWPAWMPVLVFVLFRIFDIAKPWPVRQAQRLPGGLGVVADDLLAAGWVNVVLALLFR